MNILQFVGGNVLNMVVGGAVAFAGSYFALQFIKGVIQNFKEKLIICQN